VGLLLDLAGHRISGDDFGLVALDAAELLAEEDALLDRFLIERLCQEIVPVDGGREQLLAPGLQCEDQDSVHPVMVGVQRGDVPGGPPRRCRPAARGGRFLGSCGHQSQPARMPAPSVSAASSICFRGRPWGCAVRDVRPPTEAALANSLDEVIVKHRARLSIGGNAMGLVLLLIVLVLLFGGGGFYLGPPYHYYGGGLGTILIIVIVVLLLRG
jgi:hypothetical protein